MIYHFEGLKRVEIEEAHAGDIIGITGFEDVFIGETIADKPERGALPYIPIDPPTIQMEFAVNDGPLGGLDGKLVTARHIWERLVKETRTNVALRIAQTNDPKVFAVSGRGEMQIAILVEQMRREGYEVLVSRPEVLWKKASNGEPLEPIEKLFVEVPSDNLGAVMENLSFRKAQIISMNHVSNQVSIEALIPMRGLIGFETDLVNMTRGLGVMSHLFHEFWRSHLICPEYDSRARPAYGGARRPGLCRHDCGRERARERYPRQSGKGEKADEHAQPGRRQGHPAQCPAPVESGARARIHRRR
jgi:GTP-binding protein